MSQKFLVLVCVLLGLCCCLGAASAREMVYYFDLSTDPGWTTEGGWQYGASDSNCCFTGAHSSGGLYGHALDADYPPGMGPESLTTTALDCTGLTGVVLHFWMAQGVCSGIQLSVEASNDGLNWTSLLSQNCGRGSWGRYEYDLSAIADDQPTVYVRWTLGPESNGNSRWGVDVDDVGISAQTGDPSLNILVWTPYSRDEEAFGNIWTILSGIPHAWLSESSTEDETELGDLLQDAQVLVIGTPEWRRGKPRASLDAPPGVEDECMADCGSYFVEVLHDFVARGGTVIFTGETMGASGLMNATGLIRGYWIGSSVGGGALLPAASGSPLLDGLTGPLLAQHLTNSYRVAEDVQTAVTDPTGGTVVAHRDQGFGGSVLLGYSYNTYDDNAARLLRNAVGYPRNQRQILLYDTSTNHATAEALTRLWLPYTTAGPGDFDALLASQSWDAVLVDNPSQAAGSWGALAGFIRAGGRVAISTGDLQAQPELQEELGISQVAALNLIPPVYWTPEAAPYVDGLPELLTWNDIWPTSGYRLTSGDPANFVFAQFEAVPTSPAQAALIVSNDGRTLVHGFLWDEENQDADTDSVQDVVELLMREVQHLLNIPTVDFTASPTAGGLPLTVSFTDHSSGQPTDWYWDFGDGGSSSEQHPVYTYAEPGTYAVTLTVSGEEGMDSRTKPDYIQAVAGAPSVDFLADSVTGTEPLTVQFSDLSTNSPTAWAWNFGDGATSAEQHPSHTYTQAGSYTVTLAATNAAGQGANSKEAYITVQAPVLSAAFAADVTSGDAPLAVSFTDQSANGPTAWSWTFGDGGTSAAQHPSHVYLGAGLYTVSLTVSKGDDSDTETKEGYLTVGTPAPKASFYATPAFGQTPLLVQFTDESPGAPTTWSWDFGDGATSTAQHPSHTYTKAGNYAVTFTVANAGGSDRLTRQGSVTSWFADAPYGYWSFGEILACLKADIVEGFPDGFHPTAIVTRDQMAVFLARGLAAGEENVPTGPAVASFSDVPTDYWAFRHIEYCKAHDIVKGYGTEYRPLQQVDRAQMAVFAARAQAGGESGLSGYTPPSTSPFYDVPVDFWAYRHIAYGHDQAIVNGYSDGTYHPEWMVTRAQMAVFLARIFHLLPD